MDTDPATTNTGLEGMSLAQALAIVVEFEAEGSKSNIGAGARTEGNKFEGLLVPLWKSFATTLEKITNTPVEYFSVDSLVWSKTRFNKRAVYLPAPYPIHGQVTKIKKHPQLGHLTDWFNTRYLVSDLVASYPGTFTTVRKYAPVKGPFAADLYPTIFKGMTTEFDSVIVLEDSDKLFEKILLEYKTAKSSRKSRIDGNAHERLSFQMMQYLEVAQLYKERCTCSLAVFSNDAMTKYRNKYHVNFRIQADRLSSAFDWFHMDYLAAVVDYQVFFEGIKAWLQSGNKRR